MVAALKEKYNKEVAKKLFEKFNYKNTSQIPRLLKICINQGVGEGITDKKVVDNALAEIALIAGQKAIATKAKKSISNFKLREGQLIGVKTTLRGNNMYEFLFRLIAVALPRVRDFRGINPKSFDGRGNYTLGITEQIIFPELHIDDIPKIHGMDITFVTSAKTDQEAHALLSELGLPFSK